MEEKIFNLFNNTPTLITHCPVCNVRYNPLEAKVLEEGDNAHLIYIKCKVCRAAILALIITNSLGVSSLGLITDLDTDDVLKFRSAKPISCDDVIEIHQLLSKQKVLIDCFE
ncbi:MAG: hypothetical protein WC508_00590 [Patescibacteria group bacterium]